MLRILSEKKKRAFYEPFVGQTRPVLFENHKNPAFLTGFTDNYIKIEVPKPADMVLVNTIQLVELGHFTLEGDLSAQLCNAVPLESR
jgi:threonylcarbamoyladenosine tRNA methylthiotransferase MtaB